MAEIRASDQSDRNSSPPDTASIKALVEHDLARIKRTMALLKKDAFADAHSYDAAALVLQHGAVPENQLMARELALLACFRKATYNGMPALAEDRYLVRIGQHQRFGSSFSDGSLLPVEESGSNAVTDALRLDMFQPPLAFARTKGLKGIESGESMSLVMPRLQSRMRPDAKGPEWITSPMESPACRKLDGLGTEVLDAEGRAHLRGELLRMYQADAFFFPLDYHRAAELLLVCAEGPSDLLLANELAAVAIMRLHGPAWKVFAASWDRFSVAIGQRQRYGTQPGKAIADTVAPAVVRAIKALPDR